MFRCQFLHTNSDDLVELRSGIYQQTVVDTQNNFHAIILSNKTLVAIPMEKVIWTGWTD